MRVQQVHTPELMCVRGVVGTAITADAAGKPAIMVLTETALPAGMVPTSLDGYAIVEAVTGKIVAYRGGGHGAVVAAVASATRPSRPRRSSSEPRAAR